MITVHKQKLAVADVQEILVPLEAEFLHVAEQRPFEVCIWYRCNTELPMHPRKIAIVGTGHAAPGGDGKYIGTFLTQGGTFVFHVFEQRMP